MKPKNQELEWQELASKGEWYGIGQYCSCLMLPNHHLIWAEWNPNSYSYVYVREYFAEAAKTHLDTNDNYGFELVQFFKDVSSVNSLRVLASQFARSYFIDQIVGYEAAIKDLGARLQQDTK